MVKRTTYLIKCYRCRISPPTSPSLPPPAAATTTTAAAAAFVIIYSVSSTMLNILYMHYFIFLHNNLTRSHTNFNRLGNRLRDWLLATVPKLKFGGSGLKSTLLSLNVHALAALCHCLLGFEGFGNCITNGWWKEKNGYLLSSLFKDFYL